MGGGEQLGVIYETLVSEDASLVGTARKWREARRPGPNSVIVEVGLGDESAALNVELKSHNLTVERHLGAAGGIGTVLLLLKCVQGADETMLALEEAMNKRGHKKTK